MGTSPDKLYEIAMENKYRHENYADTWAKQFRENVLEPMMIKAAESGKFHIFFDYIEEDPYRLALIHLLQKEGFDYIRLNKEKEKIYISWQLGKRW
jgi:hypothetical protein